MPTKKNRHHHERTIPRRIVAVHEATHAVVAVVLRRPLHRVTIEPRGEILGRTYPGARAFSRRSLEGDPRAGRAAEAEIVTLLAARAGELSAAWHGPSGGSNDRVSAEALAARLCTTDAEWTALLSLSRIRAAQVVDRWWRQIREVAKALEQKNTLSGPAVRAIVRRTRRRRRRR
ncbi:hypothetical protein [Anaeromyxobacter oryzisoli]|uniref:hypothetical protein n=1 Tax=Anaeromyxobacter oryzisoli TaxID=2925408 RepID=UPI00241334D9|nr:hypothetical protein [Anaeromyxobacter sp. SG63]